MPAERILRRCNSDETHGGGEGDGRLGGAILKKCSSDGDMPEGANKVGDVEITDDAETRALREEVAALQNYVAQLHAGSEPASTAAAPDAGGGRYTISRTIGTLRFQHPSIFEILRFPKTAFSKNILLCSSMLRIIMQSQILIIRQEGQQLAGKAIN